MQQGSCFFLIIAFYLKKSSGTDLGECLFDSYLRWIFRGLVLRDSWGTAWNILKKMQVRTDLLLMMRVNN